MFAREQPLASATTKNPSVTYSAAGTYDVKLVVTNSNGSDSTTQTAYITVSSVVNLPLAEGFEGAAFPPANWSTQNILNDTIFWKKTTSTGGFGTSSSCMMFDDYNQDAAGARDAMIAPKYDFSGLSAANLTFDVAYARYDATYSDSLAVLVSIDCGKTFTQVYLKGGTGLSTAPDLTGSLFIPSSTQWRTETISLTPYTGHAAVTVSFQNIGHNGQSLYIDNINITGTNSPTSVNALKENAFVIYPNPSNGLFEINTGDVKTDFRIDISSILGKLVFSEHQKANTTKEYDLRTFGPGLYFVTLTNEYRSVTRKIIVQ
jgi:hypothetical protein